MAHWSRHFALVFGLFVLAGCGDDGTQPAPNSPPTLDQLWPNADGLAWSYDLDIGVWNGLIPRLYATQDSVPAVSMTDVEAELATPLPGLPDSTEAWHYKLEFAGQKRSGSGVLGQNLRSVISAPAAKPRAGSDAFLGRLLSARPDLAPRILAAHPELAAVQSIETPLFLSGGVFEKTVDHIGTYGDLDTLLNWKWLESDLSVGHEFVLQLYPQYSDDLFLHVRILGPRTVHVPSGTYENAIEVTYALDFGITTYVDEANVILGYFRTVDVGTIDYAPMVGPIQSRERRSRFPMVLSDTYSGTAELISVHRPTPAAASR